MNHGLCLLNRKTEVRVWCVIGIHMDDLGEHSSMAEWSHAYPHIRVSGRVFRWFSCFPVLDTKYKEREKEGIQGSLSVAANTLLVRFNMQHRGARSISETLWSRKWVFCPDAICEFRPDCTRHTLKIWNFVRVVGSGYFLPKICPDEQIWPFQGLNKWPRSAETHRALESSEMTKMTLENNL